MRTLRAVAIMAALLPLIARAQVPDTVELGQRVRVRVAATRGNVNLFVGNVTALSRDTLILAISGGKGTVILPRAAVAEVAVPDGHESRWRRLPFVAPLVYSAALITTTRPMPGPHSQGLRNRQYGLLAVNGLLVGSFLFRPTSERWRPLYSWLDRP
jgi:hypothetical protein